MGYRNRGATRRIRYGVLRGWGAVGVEPFRRILRRGELAQGKSGGVGGYDARTGNTHASIRTVLPEFRKRGYWLQGSKRLKIAPETALLDAARLNLHKLDWGISPLFRYHRGRAIL